MSDGAELLVIAGEASGDRAAAAVVAHLRGSGARVFGIGGGALEREGAELLVNLRDLTAMGIGEAARRAYNIGLAYGKVRTEIRRRQPTAALLVNYTEFNTRLAETLWSRGTRVLWYGAPQVWAWRKSRMAPLRRHLDRMAVMLPFEEELWRSAGFDAHYVGHPALEEWRDPEEQRATAREQLGMTPFAGAVAIVPGSRPHEVRRLLAPMLEGYETVRHDRASIDGRVLLASSLDEATQAWARDLARAFQVGVIDIDPRAGFARALPAFDAALCASGTATLECALAHAVPVICYRVGLATEVGARALMKTQSVGLPNVLLGYEAFPELLQRKVTAEQITETLGDVLDRRQELVASCEEVRSALGGRSHASQEVARMLEPWLLQRQSA